MAALTLGAACPTRPFTAARSPASRAGVQARRPLRVTAAQETEKNEGVVRGLRNWPPKPITDHGAPKPEDDPANFENGVRVRGPTDEEVAEKKKKAREESPFSNPSRPGGTQVGGGGEGSAA